MKQVWTFFMAGLFCVAVVSILFQNTHAGSEDPRVVKIKDPEVSALKTEVPGTTEMETALVKREKELAAREDQIKTAEERLKGEEERLRYRIEELESLQNEIVELQKKERDANDAAFKKLVKTFETMQPKKAAAVISVAEDDMAVELLKAMKDKKVAAILDIMDPTRAVTLSALMAKRTPAGEAKRTGGAKVRP